MYTVIAKFRHGLEQHSKIKFGVKQSVKWLGDIPQLHRFKRERHLMENRSSHQRCSVKKGVLRNLAKFTGKHLCQSLYFDNVAGLRAATLLKQILLHRCNFIKIDTPAQVFSCEFCQISKNTFSYTSGGCFCRGIFRTLSNIQDGAFCKNS